MDSEQSVAMASEAAVSAWEPIASPASHLNYWIKQAHRGFSKSFDRVLTECGIIASEWAALQRLYQPGWQSPMDLGKALGMSRGGASKLVSRLVKKGLVTKLTADFDRRFRSVGLTKQGKDLVVQLAPLEKRVDREFFRPLGNERRYQLPRWMSRVINDGHTQRMHQWVAELLQQAGLIRIDPNVLARAATKKRAEIDAMWELCKQVGEAAARGKPCPSLALLIEDT